MKIIICYPKCGNKDLEFLTPTTSTVLRCLNEECKEIFHIDDCGYDTEN